MQSDTVVEMVEVWREGEEEGGWAQVSKSLGLDAEQLKRVRRALQKEAPKEKTFGELARGWLGGLNRVRPENEEGYIRHMLPLADLTESTLKKANVERLFAWP